MEEFLREHDGPLYVKFQDMIMKKIEAGEYLPGEQLPSERVLAEKYGGDSAFASKCVAVSTVLSLITTPLWCMVV